MKHRAALLFSTLSVLAACRNGSLGESSRPPEQTPGTTVAAAQPSLPHRTLAPVSLAHPEKADSIYDLRIPLLDQDGTVKPLDVFRGHPVLVTMFYGSCASACPLLTLELKRIERELPEPTRSELRVLMVSFDAARDKPAVLARLMRERSMDLARWSLASATDDDARELAGVLNIKYRKLDNGEFFHSSAIVLLDSEGRPQARLDGLGKDAAPILTALRASSAPPS